MQLVPLQIAIEPAPLPPRVVTTLASARARIDRWFAQPGHQTGIGFIPSDYEQVWHALAAIKREHPDARRLLEWGSGFGVVAGLGALLGLDAHGIEIDGDLVTSANELLAEHDKRLSAELSKLRRRETRPVTLMRHATDERLEAAGAGHTTVRAQDAYLAELVLLLGRERISVEVVGDEQ